MDIEINGLLRVIKTNIKPAVESLRRAFREYPLLVYYYPDDSTREKISRYFVSVAAYHALRYGEVYATSTNMEGIAVWVPSENYPMKFGRILSAIPLSVFIGFAVSGGSKMQKLGEYLDNVHKRLAPFRHMYLEVIGVDPQFRGQGHSGRLIRPMLERLDKEGLPCYLETLDKKNVGIYEHFGFQVLEEAKIPETELTNWAMLRNFH